MLSEVLFFYAYFWGPNTLSAGVWMSREWCHFGINIPHQTTGCFQTLSVPCTVFSSFFCHIQRLEIFGLPCHLGWGPHMWHYKYMGLLCATYHESIWRQKKPLAMWQKCPWRWPRAPYTWNPRMKIPSLCTCTIVADNTSCQTTTLKKKHVENTIQIPMVNPLASMKPLGSFFVQFLWENENHALRHKGENREVCFDTCQLTISLGTCLSILLWAILHNPWLYEIQSLRHHSMGREDQKTQAATETTNHSYICVLHQSHQSYKKQKTLEIACSRS